MLLIVIAPVIDVVDILIPLGDGQIAGTAISTGALVRVVAAGVVIAIAVNAVTVFANLPVLVVVVAPDQLAVAVACLSAGGLVAQRADVLILAEDLAGAFNDGDPLFLVVDSGIPGVHIAAVDTGVGLVATVDNVAIAVTDTAYGAADTLAGLVIPFDLNEGMGRFFNHCVAAITVGGVGVICCGKEPLMPVPDGNIIATAGFAGAGTIAVAVVGLKMNGLAAMLADVPVIVVIGLPITPFCGLVTVQVVAVDGHIGLSTTRTGVAGGVAQRVVLAVVATAAAVFANLPVLGIVVMPAELAVAIVPVPRGDCVANLASEFILAHGLTGAFNDGHPL